MLHGTHSSESAVLREKSPEQDSTHNLQLTWLEFYPVSHRGSSWSSLPSKPPRQLMELYPVSHQDSSVVWEQITCMYMYMYIHVHVHVPSGAENFGAHEVPSPVHHHSLSHSRPPPSSGRGTPVIASCRPRGCGCGTANPHISCQERLLREGERERGSEGGKRGGREGGWKMEKRVTQCSQNFNYSVHFTTLVLTHFLRQSLDFLLRLLKFLQDTHVLLSLLLQSSLLLLKHLLITGYNSWKKVRNYLQDISA